MSYKSIKAKDIKVGDRLKSCGALDYVVKSVIIGNYAVHVSYSMPGGVLWRGEWELNTAIEVAE